MYRFNIQLGTGPLFTKAFPFIALPLSCHSAKCIGLYIFLHPNLIVNYGEFRIERSHTAFMVSLAYNFSHRRDGEADANNLVHTPTRQPSSSSSRSVAQPLNPFTTHLHTLQTTLQFISCILE